MEDVISLGIGEPDFDTPRSIVQAGVRSLELGQTHYTSNSGTIELRQALAEHLKRLYGVEYDARGEILVTVGVSEALYLALTAVLDPGDEVIVPTPCFVAYQPEVVFAGGTPVPLPTTVEDQFQASAQAVEAQITPRTKALLIGYPNNPTGAVMSPRAHAGARRGGRAARSARHLRRDLRPPGVRRSSPRVFRLLARDAASGPSPWAVSPRTTP